MLFEKDMKRLFYIQAMDIKIIKADDESSDNMLPLCDPTSLQTELCCFEHQISYSMRFRQAHSDLNDLNEEPQQLKAHYFQFHFKHLLPIICTLKQKLVSYMALQLYIVYIKKMCKYQFFICLFKIYVLI